MQARRGGVSVELDEHMSGRTRYNANRNRALTVSAGVSRSPDSTVSPRKTFVVMPLIAFSSSEGTSLTSTVSASITLARRLASGRSSEVMRRGRS